MKTITRLSIAVLALLMATGSAMADPRRHGHGHGGPRVHFGIAIGAPLWDPWYPRHYYPYYPPYYAPYYAPIVIERSEPPVYIQQQSAPPAPQAEYWYYCTDARAYYPYVKECPGGWQKVLPQAPR